MPSASPSTDTLCWRSTSVGTVIPTRLRMPEGFGGPAGLAYLRSLPMVDKNNIGLEGHSMGGWTVLAAAKAMPGAYKAMVLEGSSTGPPFAADGTPAWPKNLLVVYSRYDEFSKLMWGVDRAADVGQSRKLMALFGSAAPVVPGQLYGSVDAGTARLLMNPAVTHPGDHFSPEAITDAVEVVQRRPLKAAPTGRPIFLNVSCSSTKEIGTLIALLGVKCC